jgi:hypothetical protein
LTGLFARAPDSITPAAVRRRRYRARLRAGKRVLTIEADDYELIRTLIEAGYVTAAQSIDRRAIETATARVLADWVRHWRESHA